MKKSIILITVFIMGLIMALIHKPYIETDILKSVIKDTPSNNTLLEINKYSNSDINVIFKNDDSDILKSQCDDFCKKIKSQNIGEIVSADDNNYLEILKQHPQCFLTKGTRYNLIHKKYDKVASSGMALLYAPMNVPMVSLENDPYLLVTDYVNQNFNKFMPDSFYSTVKVQSNSIDKVIKLSKKYDLYLSGTPVHSFKTAQKSSIQINIFCFLATVFILGLCRYLFENYKIFFPIVASILFGFSSGFIVTALIFHTIHILTLVFATTLIGISVDYSFHYYSQKNHDKLFLKNLTASMLTTVLAFLFLLVPDILLLNQISVYTIGGIVAVYLFVLIIYPNIKIETEVENDIPCLHLNKKWFLIISALIIVIGLSQIKTDDSIKSLYKPDKDLQQAEKINQQITNPQNKEVSFVVVKLINKEEQVTDVLSENNIDYLCMTKFIPSISRQKENIELVNDLYKNNLNSYGTFLTDEQKNKLKNNKNTVVSTSFSQFKLDKNRSIIMVYGLNKQILKNISDIQIVNIQQDISKSLYKCRKDCQRILPILFIIMFLFLSLLYRKKAIKIIVPPIFGVMMSVAFSQVLGVGISIFSVLTIFLILGFTIDYSIFKSNGGRNSNTAVLASSLSTVFSFFLLSFASFRLISSIGLLLTVGITASYISSCVLFDETEHT